MVDFEVINIKNNKRAFTVEIEITKTRERRFFGYPFNNGWEQEINGEPRFIKDIKRKLADEEALQDISELEKQKKKIIGKKFRVSNNDTR